MFSSNSQELMAAVQFGVLKTADDVASTVADRNAMNEMKFDEEVVSRVSALVWDTVVEDWADDLVSFSSHAGRQMVNLDDLALMTRRNPDLFKMACEMANVKTKLGESDASNLKTTKGKKRKANNINQPGPSKPIKFSPLPSREPSLIGSRSCSPVLVIRTPKKNTNSPNLKQAKLEIEIEEIEPEKRERRHSFLKTPAVKQMTSTPKVTSIGVSEPNRRQLFEKEFTPIRPSTSKEGTTIGNMTNIQEEDENIQEPDSFDRIFGDHIPTTSSSSKPNLSSLIRRAEEDPPPTENTVLQRMEYERLNAMVPKEQEYDSFDDDIIVETVVKPKNSTSHTSVESEKRVTFSMSAKLKGNEKETKQNRSAECSKSPDIFANSRDNSSSTMSAGAASNQPVTPLSRGPNSSDSKRKGAVFSNKLSAFKFDDEDSLDAPVKGSIPSSSNQKANVATDFSNMANSERKINKEIATETLSDDSFDELPAASKPMSKNDENVPFASNPTVLDDSSKDSFDIAPVKPKSTEKEKPALIDLYADSFDIPISNHVPTAKMTNSAGSQQESQPMSQSSSQSIPKWKATADKWKKLVPAKSTPKTTPKGARKTSGESESTKKKKQNRSLEYDSFDEFDFDV